MIRAERPWFDGATHGPGRSHSLAGAVGRIGRYNEFPFVDERMTRTGGIGGTLVVWLFGVVAVCGQQTGSPLIAEVTFEGLNRSSESFVRNISGLKEGAPYQGADVDAAVARLLRTGRFLTVTRHIAERADGVHVTLRVHERPLVTSIDFQGNSKYGDKRLREHLRIAVGDPVDLYLVREGRERIIALYRDAGYSDVEVTIDEAKLQDSGVLVCVIREGKPVRIRKILFTGNNSFTARHLRRQIETKTWIWIFRPGAYDPDRALADEARLQNFYRDAGFLDATVTHSVQTASNGRDLTVTFAVEEGTRYRIESIEFTGNTAFTDEALGALISSKTGAFVKRPAIERDARAIQEHYQGNGYIYTRVNPTRVFSDKPGLVRVSFAIAESPQFHIGRVSVRGNTRTRDKVVRRALKLYPPDDVFDLNAVREAERALVGTHIFSAAKVIPVGDQPDVRDAVIDVTEADKAGDFLFGFGVTSNSGLAGSIVLDLQNFDLFDYPRSPSELFKFRSFYGGGQRLRIELQPGTDLSRFRIDFTEPYLNDRPVRFDFSAFLFERGRDGYDERRGGADVSFGKRFEHGRLKNWSGELAFGVQSVRISGLDLFAAREIRDDEGSHLLTSVKGSLVRDRTDSRFLPTTGNRVQVSFEQFVGSFTFGKLQAKYNHYTTILTDPMDRKTVLQLKAQGGVVIGDAPVFERYYAGGTGSIRGFAFRGVGERSGLDDNNIGGDYLLLLGAEYSYPLYGENLRGHVFLDTGTAGSGTYRAAVGTGVRFTLDLFGPLPIEFNLALPISTGEDDDEQVFSFLIGRLF